MAIYQPPPEGQTYELAKSTYRHEPDKMHIRHAALCEQYDPEGVAHGAQTHVESHVHTQALDRAMVQGLPQTLEEGFIRIRRRAFGYLAHPPGAQEGGQQ